jgi:hypothetical protein
MLGMRGVGHATDRPQVLVLVSTWLRDIEGRAVIRATWMKELHELQRLHKLTFSCVAKFAVGAPSSHEWSHRWQMGVLEDESSRYGDIVQLPHEEPPQAQQHGVRRANGPRHLDLFPTEALLKQLAYATSKRVALRFQWLVLIHRNTYVNLPRLVARLPSVTTHQPSTAEHFYLGGTLRVPLANFTSFGAASAINCSWRKAREHHHSKPLVTSSFGGLHCDPETKVAVCGAAGLHVLSMSLAVRLAKISEVGWAADTPLPPRTAAHSGLPMLDSTLALCRMLLRTRWEVAENTSFHAHLLDPLLQRRAMWIHSEALASSQSYFACHRSTAFTSSRAARCVDASGRRFSRPSPSRVRIPHAVYG